MEADGAGQQRHWVAAVAIPCSLPVPVHHQAAHCGPSSDSASLRLNCAATKFIGGHSDVTAGILAVRDKQLADRLYFLQVRLH